MTRHEKSDSQLDAEAAGRPSLEEQIDLHRELYRDSTRLDRLVSRQPPLTRYDSNDWTEGTPVRYGSDNEYVIEPAARIGMSMAGAMIRRLSDSPGAMFPWPTALYRLRYACRREHPYHRAADRPYWRGSLCHQLVVFTVIREWSIENAAKILRYDRPEPTLRYAFGYIEASIDEARRKAERRQREETSGPGAVPLPVHEQRHDQPGLHRQDCPKCRKEDAA